MFYSSLWIVISNRLTHLQLNFNGHVCCTEFSYGVV